MRIVKVDICDLHAFKFAGISSFQGTFTDTLQIILGTNGSGKTNLIKQLSPLPPPRSDYGNNGYRRLVISHRGDTYELISDFSNKTSPHSFIRNGKSLNEGGTTNVQIEMIESYLGWTSEVQSVTYGAYNFCKMTTGTRRALLLNANPKNIGFIYDYYKKTGSKVRYCKNNLHALQERRALIESKLLPEESLLTLTREKEDLVKKTFDITDLMGKIKSFISSHTVTVPVSMQTWSETKQELLDVCQETRDKLWIWSHIDRAVDEDTLISQVTQEAGYIEGQLSSIETQLIDITQTLTQCEFNLSELSDEERVMEKKATVASLSAEVETLQKTSTSSPLPKDILEHKNQILSKLHDILNVFTECTITLKTRHVVMLKKQKLYQVEQKKLFILDRRQTLFKEKENLSKELTLKLTDIPDAPCAKMACPLYKSFKNTFDTTQNRIRAIDTHLAHISQKLKRIDTYIELQHQQLQELVVYADAGDRLHSFVNEHPYFKSFVSDKRTLHILQTNPLSILHRIQTYFLQSENAYALTEKKAILLKEEMELSKLSELSTLEKDKLLKELSSIKQKHTTLHRDKDDLIKKRSDIQKQKSLLLSRKTTLTTISNLTTKLNEQVEVLKTQEEIKFLSDILSDLSNENARHFSRIGEIDQVLREQSNLHSRYKEEILSQIDKLEIEKIKWEELEVALNKIPQWHTATFLNLIIKLINHYISLVFTYPFELDPINPEKNLDYRFSYKAQCPDRESVVHVSDISQCSRAQAEVVDFAFCLALRRIQGLTDYPLFTDELGSSFDIAHKTHVLDLLKHLVDEDLVSQIFLINHHALVHEGMANAEVLILNDANIMKPAVYNEHVTMIKK